MLAQRSLQPAVKKTKLDALLSLFLAAVTMAIYSRVLLNGFVNYDDTLYVTENLHVQQGLTIEGLRWAFTSLDAANWHPLTWLSHMLDVQIYGMSPMGHHATNVLLHGANTLLLFLFLVHATGASWRSFFVAMLFGIHPLHVESVAWVAERKDVLSAFFWMLTLLAYLRYSRNRCLTTYFTVLWLFAAALLSKPMAVTLPFVLLILDYWPLRRLPQITDGKVAPVGAWKHLSTSALLLEKLPFFVLAGLSLVMTDLAQERAGAIKATAQVTENILNALAAYGTYLVKMVWPGNMVVLYPYTHQPVWKALAAGILVAGISIAVWSWRDRRYLVAGWLWYLITLLPVSGIIRIGEHSIADRYTYIPLIGLFIIISWGTGDLVENRKTARHTALAAVVAVLLFFSLKTWNQILYWRDSTLLFRHAVRYTSGNWMAYHNLGASLLQRGDSINALEFLLKSVRINPEDARAYNSLSTAYGRLGYEDKAIAALKEALRLDPGFVDARYNLVRAYIQKGEKGAALIEYRILKKSSQELSDQLEPYFR